MYKKNQPERTTLIVNKSFEGETIEMKIERIVNNKEPIKDGAPLIYTDRAEGVQPDYDIRTDRFEHAIEAMDKVTQGKIAKREQTIGQKAKEGMKKEEGKPNGGPEPTQATEK